MDKKYKVPQELFDNIKVQMSHLHLIDVNEEDATVYSRELLPFDEQYKMVNVRSISGLGRARYFYFKDKGKVKSFSVDSLNFEAFLNKELRLYPKVFYEVKREVYEFTEGYAYLETLPFGTFFSIEEEEPQTILETERLLKLEELVEPKTYSAITIEQGIEKNGIYQARFLTI